MSFKRFFFSNSTDDKILEKERYDQCASALSLRSSNQSKNLGSKAIPLPLRAPYIYYEKVLSDFLPHSHSVLELCAGYGAHTEILLSYPCFITASDISPKSLHLLRKLYPKSSNLHTVVCDIECLPFQSHSFDLVVCAGGLSYGDNAVVMNEILRVLRPHGHFICVDSLNHNPIYRINRLFHVLCGRRTISTIKRMPTLALINRYKGAFSSVECQFFGGFSWILFPVSKLIGQSIALKVSDFLDRRFRIMRSAFKFVMIARSN